MSNVIWDDETTPDDRRAGENPWRNRGKKKYTVYMQDDGTYTCGFCVILNAIMRLEKHAHMMFRPSFGLYGPGDIYEMNRAAFDHLGGMGWEDCCGYARATFFPNARLERVKDASEFRSRVKQLVKQGAKVVVGVKWHGGGRHFVLVTDREARFGKQKDLFTIVDSLEISGGCHEVRLKIDKKNIVYSQPNGGDSGHFAVGGADGYIMPLSNSSVVTPPWLR